MSLSNILVPPGGVKSSNNVEVNNLTVDGTTNFVGPIITSGNIAVHNSFPVISITNDANNSNRATLQLQGATPDPGVFKIQSLQDGTAALDNFATNKDIAFFNHGSGHVDLFGPSYPAGPYLLELDASNKIQQYAGSNITVHNTIPALTIRNDANNSNRATLILDGATPSPGGFLIQAGQDGTGIISTFATNKDIALLPNGTGHVSLIGTSYPAGPYDLALNASNQIVPAGSNPSISFTPSLSFGGSTTGITYVIPPAGFYQINGKILNFGISLFLSSAGTAIGNAKIDGFPIPASLTSPAGNFFSLQNQAFINDPATPGVLIGSVIGAFGSGDTSASLSDSGTGVGNLILTNASFNNNSIIQANGFYFID